MIKNHLGDYKARLIRHIDVLTKFLDFDEQKEIYGLESNEVKLELNGGYSDAERKRAYLSSNNEILKEDFKIGIIQSKYDKKFASIGHRNVLGAIMALGIERNTFGDIIVDDDKITIFVSLEIKDYIMNNLTDVCHYRLEWYEIDEYIGVEKPEEIKTINVASMRLDCVIARCIPCGRSEAQEMIETGLVLINHRECTSSTHQVKENDMLSIRKFGRITIYECLGTSKKDRLILRVGVKH